MRTRPFAAAAALLVACTEPMTLPPAPGAAAPGTLYGTVTSSRPGRSDRAPVAGATVTLLASSVTTKTNDEGAFLLEGVVERTGIVLVRHDGDTDGVFERQRSLRLEDVNAGPGRHIGAGEVILAENARVRGRVRLGGVAGSGGHAGTTLYVPHGPFLALTADDGSWSLSDLPEGPVTLAALRAGYAPHTWDGIVLRGGEELVLRDLWLEEAEPGPATGALEGRVVLLGTPAGADPVKVTLADAHGAPTPAAVAADLSFAAEGLAPGLYRVSAARAGYLTAVVPGVAVLAGEKTRLPALALAPGADPATCTDGAACQPEDPCRTGVVRCSAGGAECVPGDFRAAGSACGAGQVCSAAGVCAPCAAGAACTPDNACHAGSVSCASGEPVCADSGTAVAAGTACGADRVCSPAGECIACESGRTCAAGPCRIGAVACGTGAVECPDLGLFLPAGTECGASRVCSPSAECVTCEGGAACVPPNRCHTGETRCDTGILRCADTGQPVAPGTECGPGRVCDPAGSCVRCEANAACVPDDPCHVGRVVCASGVPECEDTGALREAGARCGDGFVCSAAGACVACPEGQACQPSAPCRTGVVACASGGPVCAATSTRLAPGFACGDDLVCDTSGECVPCAAGAACAPANPCHAGRISCVTGSAECIDTGNAANVGDACTDGSVCDPSGTCAPCAQGAGCVPADPCRAGVVACGTGLPVCEDGGTDRAPGTPCGDGKVCSPAAACIACVEGASCPGPTVCRAGALACGSGVPTCEATAQKLAAGTGCGTKKVCSPAGDCVDCDAGTDCTPADPCHVGAVACGSGAPLCADTLVLRPAGRPCASSKVCNVTGACVDCAAGAACTPTNPCRAGRVQCSTGAPVCLDAGTDIADGTVCAADKVCKAGACVACVANAACVPADPCRQGRTSCATGESVCLDAGTDAADGTACGTLKVCVAGDCVPSGLSVSAGDGQSGYTGQLLGAIELRMTNAVGAPIGNELVTLQGPSGSVVVPASGRTDQDGRLVVTWRLPRNAGAHVLVALAASGGRAEVTATASIPPAGTVYTLMNTDHASGTDPAGGAALSAHTRAPAFFARAADGTLYYSETAAHVVRRITPEGLLQAVAGQVSSSGFTGDGGPASAARLYYPAGLALDEAAGRLYVGDSGNNRVRVINLATGTINTYAGGGTAPSPGYGDYGPALAAAFDEPGHLGFGPDGALYVADVGHSRIRRIDPADTLVTTPVPTASYNDPMPGLANCDGDPDTCRFLWDGSGRLYVAGKINGGPDAAINHWYGIVRRNLDGTFVGIAGKYQASTASGAPATSTGLLGPTSIAFDPAGNLFFSEKGGHRIRYIETTTTRVLNAAGSGVAGGGGDFGAAALAQFDQPVAVLFEPDGGLLVGERGNYALRRVAGLAQATALGAELQIVTGTGQTLLPSQQSEPLSVRLVDGTGTPLAGFPLKWSAIDAGTALYASATTTNSLGVVSTVARPGPAVRSYALQVAYTDLLGRHVAGSPAVFTLGVQAPAAGTIFTPLGVDHVSGSTAGLPGPASRVQAGRLNAVVRASDGTLYVADASPNHIVLRVTPAGHATRLAGAGGSGFSGDGGPAAEARLNQPRGLALSPDERTLYIADYGNDRVRSVDLVSGLILTVAGGGTAPAPGYGDGGPANSASLSSCNHVAVGPDGLLYISDSGHNRVRRVNPATGLIETWFQVPATGSCGDAVRFNGCGAAGTEYGACHVSFDPAGNAYIAGDLCGTTVGSTINVTPGVVRRATDGTITRFTGRYAGATADGTAALQFLWSDHPMTTWVDANTAYLVARRAHKVFRYEAAGGTVSRYAGDGTAGYLGDYVPVDQARLNYPCALVATPDGHLLLPDGDNAALRMVW